MDNEHIWWLIYSTLAKDYGEMFVTTDSDNKIYVDDEDGNAGFIVTIEQIT